MQTASWTPNVAPEVKTNSVLVKSEPVQEAETPITYIPRHMRQEMTADATTNTPNRNEQAPRNVRGAINLNTPIQTPVQQAVNTNRGQYRRTEPLPLPQPEQRQMSFTEQTTAPADEVQIPADDETSYSMDSEDDAFYANADLGDGDLGRPIDFEEGLGGVSVSDVSLDRGDANTSGNLRESSKALQGNSLHGRTSPGSGRGETTTAGSSRFPLANAPRPQAQASSLVASRAPHGVDHAPRAPVAPPTKRESGSSSSVSTSSTEARRSMGGFHYPSGMVCVLCSVTDCDP